MTIEFDIKSNKNYFISTWSGKITDHEIINSYKDFYEGPLWSKQLNELGDISRADVSSVTPDGITSFCKYVESYFKSQGVTSAKTAVYAPSDLPFGLARVYQAWTDESSENFRVFRDMESSIAWLKSNEQN